MNELSKSMMRDESEIRALIADWSRAIEARDAAAIVAAYTPDTVLFDAIPPFKSVGAEAIRAVWEQCLPFFPDRFASEHSDIKVVVEGDIAFVYGFHHFRPTPPDHPCGTTWMRVTGCLRRIDGNWRVLHEHVSVPFDPMTGKAVLVPDLTEDGSAPTPTGTAADRAAQFGVHRVTPHLVCAGAANAIEFYKSAFDAVELMRLPGPDGRLMHACLSINGSSVMLVDENPGIGILSPKSLGGTAVTLHLVVDDADAVAAKAVEAGARAVMPVADMFWGDRYGIVEDPFGHRWAIATPSGEPLTGEKLEEAARKAMTECAKAGVEPGA